MRLRLTLTGSTAGNPIPSRRWWTDVEIDAPRGTTWAQVRQRVRAGTPRWNGEPRVDGRPLPPGALLGHRPLLHGAVLDVGGTPEPGGAPGVRGAPGARRAGRARPLAVVGGPDAGRLLHLSPGAHVLGRGGADVLVADPALSRRHVLVCVEDDARPAALTDLGSTNGTWLEEAGHREDLTGTWHPTTPAQRLVAGSSTFALAADAQPAAACTGDGEGHVLVNRAPRLQPGAAFHPFRLPEPPAPVHRQPLPWLAVSVPLVLAVVMAFVWSPLSLLLGLASPVLLLGQWWLEHRNGARGRSGALAEHARACAEVREDLARALAVEHAERHERSPDAATVREVVRGPGRRLWERTAQAADALSVRVGLGDLPATGCALDGEAEASLLRGVPVTVALPQVGVLGISGPREAVLGCARFLLVQVAAWHSPAEVAVAVLSAASVADVAGGEHEVARDAAAWEWASWLPHSRTALHPGAPLPPESRIATAGGAEPARGEHLVAELLQLVHSRASAAEPAREGIAGPRVVLLLDGARDLRSVPGVADLLRRGPTAGLVVICLDADPAQLPAECRGVLSLAQAAPAATEAELRLDGEPPLRVRVDGTGPDWAWSCARALAPLRDATPTTATARLPATSRLVDLLRSDAAHPVDPHDAGSVARLWRQVPATTLVPLGEDGHGPVVVDLAADGPHVLLAGTTGSGKSELLQSLVAALAVRNRPDELQFLLVDYKGGSAFAECARLPHCAGLVTDLDEHLTRRALRSLTAEVRRRERILRSAGVADLRALQERARAGDGQEVPAPFARLVLVVDEFRVLAEELPEFVGGLVRVAAVGRSLGVHLVLATQRPAGIVSPDIRANTNLRIALRVQDRADAQDVVGTAEPALLDERLPGRAVLRSGSGRPRTVQAARVGGPVARATAGLTVRVVQPGSSTGDRPPSTSSAQDPSDLALLVPAVRRAAAEAGVAAATSPWLPPLPARVATSGLPAPTGTPRGCAPVLAWGLLDLPDEQRQESAVWDLGEGDHLLVVGTVRSGRSTLVRTLVTAASAPAGGPGVHCYVLDAGGALAGLGNLPHVGAVVGPQELWRAGRVLARLLADVEARRARFAAEGVADLAEQHRRAPRAEWLPYLVLAVDGWDVWARVLADVDLGAGVDAVLRLLREASAVGVRVVLTGDRALLTSAPASAAGTVVLLRLADRADAALAGVNPRQVPSGAGPGRGLRVHDGRAEEVQVAEAPGAAVPPVIDGGAPARIAGPWRVRPLPARCPPVVPTLPAASTGPAPPGARPVLPPLPVGRGGDSGEVVHLDLSLPGGCAVVAGPPGSGRSTVLAALAAAAVAAGWPVVLVAPGPHPRGGAPLRGPWGPGEGHRLTAALDAALGSGRPALVLVDDVVALGESDVEDVLLRRLAARSGERIVGAGTDAELAAAYRGLPVLLRRPRRGVLLGLGPLVDGDVLGRRPAVAPGPGPGAGFLVHPVSTADGEEVVPVRIARPTPGAGVAVPPRTVSG